MNRIPANDESEPGFKAQEYNKGEEAEFLGLIHKIVEEATAQPTKVIINMYYYSLTNSRIISKEGGLLVCEMSLLCCLATNGH